MGLTQYESTSAQVDVGQRESGSGVPGCEAFGWVSALSCILDVETWDEVGCLIDVQYFQILEFQIQAA